MRRLFLALPLVALLLGAGCAAKKTVVGVVLPLSGDAQAYGTSIRAGVKLAFDEAQREHTVKNLEVRYADSASDPERAAAEARTMYEAGAIVVIGGATSPEAKSMIPVAAKQEAVLLSPSASDPNLAASSNLFFRVFPSDALEGAAAARFIGQTRKIDKLVLFTEDNSYCHGLLPVFTAEYQKEGGQITDTIRIGQDGWEHQAAKLIKEKKPAAIYVCGYGEAILASLLEIRNAEFPGLVVTTSALSTVDLVWRGGRLVEGVYLPTIKLDLQTSEQPTAGFVKRYKEANSDLAPDVYAAHGYDAALAVLAALKTTNQPLTRHSFLENLLMLSDVAGVTGRLAFDDVGNIKRELQMHCIRNGKVEPCEE